MKRSKKGASKKKGAKIKSRYGSRSKIKKVKSKKIKSVKGGSGNASEEECKFLLEQVKVGFNPKCKWFFKIKKPGSSSDNEDDYLTFNLDFDISDVYHSSIGTNYKYEKTDELNTKYIDPFYIRYDYFGYLRDFVKEKTKKLIKSDLDSFNKKWNSEPRMAKITKDKKDSDTDKFLTFDGRAEIYRNNGYYYWDPDTNNIPLYGPNFNVEITGILKEIETESGEFSVTNTKNPGGGEIEF